MGSDADAVASPKLGNVVARVAVVLAFVFAAVVAAEGPSAGVVGFEDDQGPQVGTARVVGGSPAPPGAYPFMAYVRIGNSRCGGALIAPTWVVSAAHCVVSGGSTRPPGVTSVVIGRDNLSSSAGETIGVARIEVPPRALTSDNDDIALLELVSPSQFGTPIAYADPSQSWRWSPGQLAKVIGWGAVNGDATAFPTLLQELDLPIVNDDVCTATWLGYEAANAICAGGAVGEDACLGDSGGPLVVPASGSSWLLVGVVSGGSFPCAIGLPGFYTEVASYVGFIECTTGLGGSPTSPLSRIDGGASACAMAERLSVGG